jgi:hypothetical protein
LVKLISGTSFSGQLAERDGAGHRLCIGIDIIGWLLVVDWHWLELHLTSDRIDACGQIDLRTNAHPLLDLLLQLIGQIGIVA